LKVGRKSREQGEKEKKIARNAEKKNANRGPHPRSKFTKSAANPSYNNFLSEKKLRRNKQKEERVKQNCKKVFDPAPRKSSWWVYNAGCLT